MCRAFSLPFVFVCLLLPARSEVTLAPDGEPGEPFVLEGRVMSAHGPMRDVLVHAYHADDPAAGAARNRLEGTSLGSSIM